MKLSQLNVLPLCTQADECIITQLRSVLLQLLIINRFNWFMSPSALPVAAAMSVVQLDTDGILVDNHILIILFCKHVIRDIN